MFQAEVTWRVEVSRLEEARGTVGLSCSPHVCGELREDCNPGAQGVCVPACKCGGGAQVGAQMGGGCGQGQALWGCHEGSGVTAWGVFQGGICLPKAGTRTFGLEMGKVVEMRWFPVPGRRCHRTWWSIQVRSYASFLAHPDGGRLCLRAPWDRTVVEVLCTQSSSAPGIHFSLWRDWDQ